MPGLLRGMARTAVIAGTASAVAGRVQRHQAEKFADRDAQIYAQREQAYEQQVQPAAAPAPAPAPAAPAPAADPVSELERLGKLKADGILTEDEFAAAKAKVLGG